MGEMTPEQREAALRIMGRASCEAFCANPDETAPDGSSPEYKATWIPRWQIEAESREVSMMLDALIAAGFVRAPGPPTDEEVERAAIAWRLHVKTQTPWEELSPEVTDFFRNVTRAALTAFLAGERQEDDRG